MCHCALKQWQISFAPDATILLRTYEVIVRDAMFRPPWLRGEDLEWQYFTWSAIADAYREFDAKFTRVRWRIELDWSEFLGVKRWAWDVVSKGGRPTGVEMREKLKVDDDLFLFDSSLTDDDLWSSVQSGKAGDLLSIPCQITFYRDTASEEAIADATEQALWRLSNDIYLAANLSYPGSCGLTDYWQGLVSYWFSSARNAAEELGWPPFLQLDVTRSADWLKVENLRSVDVSHRPVQRALLALLNISRPTVSEADSLLWTAVALESLYDVPRTDARGPGGAAAAISQKVFDRLGPPSIHVKGDCESTIGRFYWRRNMLLHKIHPVRRPDRRPQLGCPEGEEAFALAIVLATLQYMIDRGIPERRM